MRAKGAVFGALSDAEQRARSLDPSGSFHLEAPAGSGKTFLLTARFLRLLGLVEHPQQILAMTFTNKAASEMRERVCRYLQRAKRGERPEAEPDGELLDAAAKALARHQAHEPLLMGGELLRIQTFHSFCHALAAQAPLEAGIAPGSTLMAEREQTFFLREVIEDTLREVALRRPDDPCRTALENRLLYLNNSWGLLAAEMEGLMQRREVLYDLTAALDRTRTEDYAARAVRELVEVELRALRGAFAGSPLGGAWSSFIEDLENRGASAGAELPCPVPGTTWEELPQWRRIADTLLTKAGAPRKSFGPASGFYSGFGKTPWCDLIRELGGDTAERLHRIRELPVKEASRPDAETLFDLILLLHAIIEAYDERCRGRRLLDFSALEMAALRLFDQVRPSDLQLLLDHRVRHVLVDEFQDTSRQQWRLLRHLFEGWEAGDAKTLFVVGDPKQSIYAFRKAEVMLFTEAKNGLPIDEHRRLPLESLVLSTNFRSQPHLIQWANGLFGQTVMRDPRPELDEVPFIPSVASPATRPVECPEPPELALFNGWPAPAAARRREAEWLARNVWEETRESPDTRIGVLLFARTHLPAYLEAFQRWNVPVQVAEGLKLPERPEVKYLRQLCRALVLPHDDLAWASQLHSPWLVLGFDDLYAVSLETGDSWVEKIRSFAQKDERVAGFWNSLEAARRHLGHEPLADVMETAWLDLGGARIVSERWGGRGLACCRRFFQLIRDAETHEPVETLRRLEELLENAYEPVDPETARSGVSVMTVHRAKGLEFDSVYLPFLDWNPVVRQRSSQQPYLLERVPGSGELFLLAAHPDRLRGEPDPLFSWLARLQADRAWGEAKRLFYVAVTRSRTRLHLSGVVPLRKSSEDLIFPTKCPLAWLNEHFGFSESPGAQSFSLPEGSAGGEVPAAWRREWSAGGRALRVLVEPAPSEPPSGDAETYEPVEIHPAAFERERPLFRITSPSSLALPYDEAEGEEDFEPSAPWESPATWPRLRGTLVHRLLADFACKRKLPSIEAIRSRLGREGMDAGRAGEAARSVLAEVERCLEDPWLSPCFALPPDLLFVEYSLESLRDPREIISGKIDLAAYLDGRWRLIDYKTSRGKAGESAEALCRRELERYAPQLAAYRQMWARLKGVEEGKVEVYVYLTAFNLRRKSAD